MIAIYTAGYNLQSMGFSWKETLTLWLRFLRNTGQIVVAANTSTDETPKRLRDFFEQYRMENPWCNTKTVVIDAAISYDDPEFDGKLKALALSHCTEPYAILLDMDEIIPIWQTKLWAAMVRELENRRNVDSLMVPVVDLIADEQHFKGPISSKWYIHRNSPNITRGVVKWAYREDGSIDTSRSDTCELKTKDTGELVRSASILIDSLPDFLKIGHLESGETPYVIHTGWLNLEQRLKQTEFWQPVWENRNKRADDKPKTTLADLEKIQRFRHNLPDWRIA